MLLQAKGVSFPCLPCLCAQVKVRLHGRSLRKNFAREWKVRREQSSTNGGCSSALLHIGGNLSDRTLVCNIFKIGLETALKLGRFGTCFGTCPACSVPDALMQLDVKLVKLTCHITLFPLIASSLLIYATSTSLQKDYRDNRQHVHTDGRYL